ncbi:MAG: peptidoglycan DD-metalloendopeptidase family protein [Pseudomonadota bacterium]
MAQTFGKRKQPHTVIIARGDSINHFQIRPWMAALALAIMLAGSVGYLGATAYLIFRDDIINASLMRQARMQHAYEDRISALRAQVDRITSHRLLDQQFVESKIAELSSRQDVLAKRATSITPLLERASGLQGVNTLPGVPPLPKKRPGNQADEQAVLIDDTLTTGAVEASAAGLAPLNDVQARLAEIEQRQLWEIANLTQAAQETHADMIKTAKAAGLPVTAVAGSATGGPFIPAAKNEASEFDVRLAELGLALETLDAARASVSAFPIAHPAPGKSITSRYGNRRDPIIGRTAFHAGIDFRTPTGTPIYATAAGTVTQAGRHGGYGKLVEIQHANGLTTRYAHLSRIRVKKGQKVAAGTHIGAAGSTGRSTGPHLHYEVRRNDKPTNPMTYLKAGNSLKKYVN